MVGSLDVQSTSGINLITNSRSLFSINLPKISGTKSSKVGELIGYVWRRNGTGLPGINPIISNTLFSGTLNCPNCVVASVGALAGDVQSTPPAGVSQNNYYNSTEYTGALGELPTTGLSDSQIKQSSNFTGFDFANTWKIDEGVSYPKLQWEP